jgi:hypothetical protein
LGLRWSKDAGNKCIINSGWKTKYEQPNRGWDGTVRYGLSKYADIDWIQLAQDWAKWPAVVTTAMKTLVPTSEVRLLTN